MRLLVVGPSWIGGWVEGVERAALALGHATEVFHYDSPHAPTAARLQSQAIRVPARLRDPFRAGARLLGAVWERQMNRRLVQTAGTFRPNLVLLLNGETVEAETLHALRGAGSTILAWWVDDPLAHGDAHRTAIEQLPHIDALFVFDRARFDELAALGARTLVYLPCAVDPHVYRWRAPNLADRARFRCQIGMAASWYPARSALIESARGLDVAIWGPGWRRSHALDGFPPGTLRGSSLSGDEAARLYGVAEVCPNAHHAQTRLGGLNMRTFEIPAAGGFELVDHVQGIDALFEVGRELVVYESPEHFRELADYYLAHPDERAAIAERGHTRVLRDHTYVRRLRVMLEAAAQA